MTAYLSAIDLILSCSICQNPLSTIYGECDQNRGLRKGGVPQDDRITKLWLTECAHLICSNHFDGGGVPLYSDQQTPRAPCPLCTAEKNDRSEKDLYYIDGIENGEFDDNIPEAYFRIPPVNLGRGNSPGQSALLFQYLALIRFGSNIYKKVHRLGTALEKWEDKKPEIVRSLGLVAPMRDELWSAGRKLMDSGHDVSSIEATLNLAGTSLKQGLHRQRLGSSQHHGQAPRSSNTPMYPGPRLDAGSRLAQGSAAKLASLHKEACGLHGQRGIFRSDLMTPTAPSSKRKRTESFSLADEMAHVLDGRPYPKGYNKGLMPPPPIPVHQPRIYMASSEDTEANVSISELDLGTDEHPRVQANPGRTSNTMFYSMMDPETHQAPIEDTNYPYNGSDTFSNHANAQNRVSRNPASATLYTRGGSSHPSLLSGETLATPHRQPLQPLNITGRTPRPPTPDQAFGTSVPQRDRRQPSIEPDAIRRTNSLDTISSAVDGEMRPNPGTPASRGPPAPGSGRRAARR